MSQSFNDIGWLPLVRAKLDRRRHSKPSAVRIALVLFHKEQRFAGCRKKDNGIQPYP
jgi:hypothetical protein